MLKKAIALPLLAGLAIPALADDAKVLPEGVLRTTVLPSFTTIDKAFDSDGDKQDIDKVSVDTVSIALEYGINDWITAGLQWAPGYAWSGEVEGNDNVDLSGANDLFVGAKFQFLGPNGLSQSDTMRTKNWKTLWPLWVVKTKPSDPVAPIEAHGASVPDSLSTTW